MPAVGAVFWGVGAFLDVCGGASVYMVIISDVAAGVYGSCDFAIYGGDGG